MNCINITAYFELDDEGMCYSRVRAEAIVIDAVSQIADVLSQISKITILHKNPALAIDPSNPKKSTLGDLGKNLLGLVTMGDIELPSGGAKKKVDDLLYQHVLSKNLGNTELIENLFELQILSPDELLRDTEDQISWLEKLGQAAMPSEIKILDGITSRVGLSEEERECLENIKKSLHSSKEVRESALFETVYLLNMFDQNPKNLEKLNGMDCIQSHVEALKTIQFQYETFFTDDMFAIKHKDFSELFKSLHSATEHLSDRLQNSVKEALVLSLCKRLPEMKFEHRLEALSIVNDHVAQVGKQSALVAKVLKELMKNVKALSEVCSSAEVESTYSANKQIFQMLGRFLASSPVGGSKEDHRLLLLNEAVEVMARFPGEISRDCRTSLFSCVVDSLGSRALKIGELVDEATSSPCLLERLGKIAEAQDSEVFRIAYGASLFGQAPARLEKLERMESIQTHLESLKRIRSDYQKAFKDEPVKNSV